MSKKYSLGSIYFNQSLTSWVDMLNTELCELYDYKKFNIDHNSYSFDSYASILSSILPHITTQDIMNSMKDKLVMSKYIALAHSAWSETYILWKGIAPDKLSKDPLRSFNTINRNDRATTHLNNLNGADLEMYNDIIGIVFEILTKKLLEAGMQNLAI